MPVVSVLMPCYNSADTIEETLKSLTCQTLADFELVAVNDGSSDLTGKILEDWSRRDGRFQVIHQSHQGIIPALNAGLAACRSPYIARMDADDRSLPQRLERQVDYLEKHSGISVAGCLVAGFPKEGVREGFCVYLEWQNSLVTDEEIRREIFVESPFAHPSVLVRREAAKKVGGYQEHGWPEDYDLWLRLYTAGARFGKVPEVLLEWREHPDRLTRTDTRYSLENFLRAKAHYLALGPLQRRDAVLIWGAGMMGRRLSKQIIRRRAPVAAFIDVDPKKIGKTRRGLPIISPDDLPAWWKRYGNPVVLAAVGARGARPLIRQQLNELGLKEGHDWWGVA